MEQTPLANSVDVVVYSYVIYCPFTMCVCLVCEQLLLLLRIAFTIVAAKLLEQSDQYVACPGLVIRGCWKPTLRDRSSVQVDVASCRVDFRQLCFVNAVVHTYQQFYSICIFEFHFIMLCEILRPI